MRRFAAWSADLLAVEQWLLPAECLLCRRRVSPGHDDLVCSVCRARWRRVPPPQCERCGQPSVDGVACRVCDGWPPRLKSVTSAVWLGPSARRAIHLFKYEGWHRIAESLVQTMPSLRPLRIGGTLIPIPLGSARLRRRGYNQSAVLAECLASLTGLPVDAGLLRRTRNTPTQTRLTPEARAANVRGAFKATGSSPRAVILVDDVFTTGATLVAGAAALAEAGAVDVMAVTFARAELPLAAASRAL